MLGAVVLFFAVTLMAAFQDITTDIARLHTTVGESMLLMTDMTATIRTACPMVKGIVLPIIAQSMLRNGLVATHTTDLLVVRLVNVGEIGINVLVGCCDRLTGFCVTYSTDQLLAAFFYTGSVLSDFTNLPIVGFGFFQCALAADTIVLAVIGFYPAAKSMAASFLDTSLTIAVGVGISGICFFAALGADLELFTE